MRPAPGLLLAAIAVTLLVLVPAGGAAAPTARASAPLHLTAPPSGGTAPRPVAGVAATVPTTGAAPWTAPSADAVCQGDIDRAGGACTAARLAEFRRSTGGASGWTPALPSNESPPAPADYGFQLVYDSADGMVLLYGQSAGVYGGFGGTEFWGFVHGTWTNLSATDPPPYCAGSALSYDPWDGYVVYFAASDSGFEDCAIAGQTWTYVGGTWTELYPSVAPPARWGAGFANDSADGYLVLFGGENETRAFNDTWTFYGGTWTNRTPVRSPSPREDPGMTYDAADGYLVLYGGDGGLRDTWQYLHGTWTDLNLSYSPPVPYPDGFAYDPVDGYAVYTNSYVYNASRYDEITWEFSGGAWHSLAPSGGLTDRPGAEQAFDYADGYLLFFGGIGPQYTPTAESWSFVGDAWTNRTDAPPAPLTGAAITDDPLDGVLLQFGGYNASGIQAETREYRDGVWTPIAPATSPPARYDAGLATDLHDGYVLLFGGIGVAGPLNDTWEFAGGDWLKLTPSTAPSPRVGTGLVYDGADGNVLLFGGAAGPLAGYDPGGYRDTWSFQGGVWKNLTAAVGPAPPSFPVNPLVYDALDGYVLDVGAYASTTPGLQQVLPVTWSYVGGVWTNRTTTPAPLGGPGAAVGYDSALSEVVLFGGFNGTGSGGPAATTRRGSTTTGPGRSCSRRSARRRRPGRSSSTIRWTARSTWEAPRRPRTRRGRGSGSGAVCAR